MWTLRFSRKERLPHPAVRADSDRHDDDGVTCLVVTGDLDFLARLRRATAVSGWHIRHARSCDEATQSLKCETIPIVIYDSDLVEDSWQTALPRLNAPGIRLCILLASHVSDDYLWQAVVRHRGYDILLKSAAPESLLRTLRFAWFWKKRSQLRQDKAGS